MTVSFVNILLIQCKSKVLVINIIMLKHQVVKFGLAICIFVRTLKLFITQRTLFYHKTKLFKPNL